MASVGVWTVSAGNGRPHGPPDPESHSGAHADDVAYGDPVPGPNSATRGATDSDAGAETRPDPNPSEITCARSPSVARSIALPVAFAANRRDGDVTDPVAHRWTRATILDVAVVTSLGASLAYSVSGWHVGVVRCVATFDPETCVPTCCELAASSVG